MALRLTVVSNNGPKLGTRGVKEFGPGGGTIGRAPDCDWVLPDPKRYLSSRHASIDFRSGSYYIVDTSMNGVYVNDAEQPVGRGKPQRLFNGDRLRIGEYEIAVEIDEDPIAPLIEENHIDPVDLAQRVEAPEPTGEEMVDAYEITGVGIEMMLTEDELETLGAPVKSRGAYFEIVDEPASADGSERRASEAGGPSAAAKARAALRAEARDVLEATQPALLAPRRPKADAAVKSDGTAKREAPAAAPAAGPSAATQTAATRKPAAAPKAPVSQAAAPAGAAPASAAPRAPAPAAKKPAQAAAAQASAAKPAASPNERAAGVASAPPGSSTPAAPSTQSRPAQPALSAPATPSAAPAAASQPAPLRGRAADLEPFFRGAGITASVPPQKVDAFLFALGQVVRAVIVNLTESLHQLAEQKSALRVTRPSTDGEDAEEVNPLKLSARYHETFAKLFMRESPDQLPPVDAVREAFEELRLHQQLLPKAVRSALDAFLARLDPEELEHKFSRGRGNVLVNAANRLKYWDLYKDLYDVVAHHPPGELPLQFLEDFAEAYERELGNAQNGLAPAAAERQAEAG